MEVDSAATAHAAGYSLDRRNTKHGSVHGGRSGGGGGHHPTHSRVTAMLLTVSFVWLALTTPYTVSCFLYTLADLSPSTAALLMPFKAVAFLLMYANHAVNFYLYCLNGRKFRRELVETVVCVRDCCPGGRRWRQRREPVWQQRRPGSTESTGRSGWAACGSCLAAVLDRVTSGRYGRERLTAGRTRGRSNTIELTTKTELVTRQLSTRKSDLL